MKDPEKEYRIAVNDAFEQWETGCISKEEREEQIRRAYGEKRRILDLIRKKEADHGTKI